VLAPELLQHRCLVPAGLAPRRPEVDQHPAVPEVGDPVGPARGDQGFEVTVGRRVADRDRRFTLAEEAEAEQADHGEDAEYGDERTSAHGTSLDMRPLGGRFSLGFGHREDLSRR
jgi:hypothetical protein